MPKVFKLREGSLQERFLASRAKLQMFGGGFGNGKTTATVIKALNLARDYPGSNGLVARATSPKLNSTIRKEFEQWTPKAWIKRDVNSKENLIELINGTVVNFSYVQQGGKTQEASTSNLLSATYDWIVFEQIEDPEVTHKDFLDLLGRLRGNTVYQGNDPTMPTTGPRWFLITCNPTRNWVYRELVKPLQDHEMGIQNEKLLWDIENNRPMLELFEGSTYENRENLAPDFIKLQEAAYKGQMRERFLLGKWGAYEGLIYPMYDPRVHMIDHELMLKYYDEMRNIGYAASILEAYDHGTAKEACYGFGFVDNSGNVFILDGYYERERTVGQLADGIKRIRREYDFDADIYEQDNEVGHRILADPAVFRRTGSGRNVVGTTVAGMFRDEGIRMTRANNEIATGIAKVQQYLSVDPFHFHPINETVGAPRLFVSKRLTWWDSEINDYYWKRDTSGEQEDTPRDGKDHAMDMTKYMLTNRPRLARLIPKAPTPVPPRYTRWREREEHRGVSRAQRYG